MKKIEKMKIRILGKYTENTRVEGKYVPGFYASHLVDVPVFETFNVFDRVLCVTPKFDAVEQKISNVGGYSCTDYHTGFSVIYSGQELENSIVPNSIKEIVPACINFLETMGRESLYKNAIAIENSYGEAN